MSSLSTVNIGSFVTNNILWEEKGEAEASLNKINSNEF
jgi:hypothetical protein